MDDILTVADARQLYANSLLMYKDKPVFVISISADYRARIINIDTGRESTVDFSTKHFKAIGNRLGFVNSNCCCVFVYRKPVRLYSVGLTTNNTGIVYAKNCNMGGNAMNAVGRISTLQIQQLVDTINGEYPEFGEAQTLAREFDGSYAFDRQFAIDSERNIFYKDKHVGVSKGSCTKDIQFFDKFNYLNLVIGNVHDKNPRDFRPA